MNGPIRPDDYDGEHLNTDEKLEEEGWAAGLNVWGVLDKVLGDALSDDTVANAQLWSLRQAVRAELLKELVQPDVIYPNSSAHRRACEIVGVEEEW
jgi:hypothetical protein